MSIGSNNIYKTLKKRNQIEIKPMVKIQIRKFLIICNK